jgi:uncharacterized membrane protein SpoIIM required for sporulation
MNTNQNHSHRPSLCSIGLLFVLGLIPGCLVAHLLRNGIYASVFHLYQTLLEQLNTLEIDLQDFFLLALRKNLKYVALLYLFAFTGIWKQYWRIFLMYIGFQNGLLLSFCIQMNGPSGVLGYFCFLLPHSLLLIPAYLLTFKLGEDIHDIFHSSRNTPKKHILYRLPAWILSILLLLLGCLSEAALNPALLRLCLK